MRRSDQRRSGDARRIECIQFLRFAAAVLVVLYHTDLQIFRLSAGAHVHLAGFGATGTDMLFVISGFVMVYISHGKAIGFGEFVFRRIARIAPLYWLLTLLMLAGFLLVPSFFNTTAFDPAHFLASLAFIPHKHPVLGAQQPFLVPGWALNYFIFFYVLFGLALFLPNQRRVAAASVVLCLLAGLRLLFPKNPLLNFYGAPIILDFVFGMLIASAYLTEVRIGKATIALVLAGSAAVFTAGVLRGVTGGHERLFYWGLSDAAVLFAFVFIEKGWGWWNPGLVAQLGESSFSIYLSNLFALAIIAAGIKNAGLFDVLGLVGTQIVFVVGALAVGVLTSVLIERPLHALILRWWTARSLGRVRRQLALDQGTPRARR
jgi:exopolysaccharide production protein ExoZ